MTLQAVDLKCPSCGSLTMRHQTGMPFGSPITCDNCGAVSFLIIDNGLIPRARLEASAGRICVACGRVARAEARYCQCGASLVRKCYWCYREVPVDLPRCDGCGYLDPGYGITPAIEGRWRTFLALLPHKKLEEDYINDRDPFVVLFESIWNDMHDGPRYHVRYQELLHHWEFEPNGYYYDPALKLLENVFAKVGQPFIDFLVNMALKRDERARAVVILLRRLADSMSFGHSPISHNEACQIAATEALALLAKSEHADTGVREEAVNSLRQIKRINR